MSQIQRYAFEGTPLDAILVNERPMFTAKALARPLGFSDARGVLRLFKRNAAEFPATEVTVVNLTTEHGTRTAQAFSPVAAHLLGMFAATPEGATFRRWLLDTFIVPHLSGARMVSREDFDALRLQVAALVSERDALRLAQGNASVDLRLALEANAGMSKLASQILTTRRAEVRHEREVELFVERPNLFAGAPLTEIDERVIAALHLHGPFDSVGALAKHLRVGVARLGDSISTLAARRAIRRSEGKIALVPQPVAQNDPSTN